MNPRIDLPPDQALVPFTVAEGLAAGLSRGRLRGRDLARPIRGVRTAAPVEARADHIRAAATRLRDRQAVAGSSAATLWGIPVPRRLERLDAPVVVASPKGRTIPSARAFRGVRVADRRFRTVVLDGVHVTDPITTWLMLAREVGLHELIAAGDALVTTSANYEGRHERCPRERIDELVAVAEEWRGSPGTRARALALERIRVGVDSPMESILRCRIVDAGLPEPVIHAAVVLADGRVFQPDLAYPELRSVMEYEGERHREKERFERDITRRELLADVGWTSLRITSANLFPDDAWIMSRIRRARALAGG